MSTDFRKRGFTLVELLVALLVFSLLAIMAYRGLNAVLEARVRVEREAERWRRVAAFFTRFERDFRLAAPRSVRGASGYAPAWLDQQKSTGERRIEFTAMSASGGDESPRRLAYALNGSHEIELTISLGLDREQSAPDGPYPVLTHVGTFEIRYIDSNLSWSDTWTVPPESAALPRAVQLHIVLDTGEEIVRVFAL